MKVFITGGSGFIGKWIIKNLVEKGYQVTGLARSDLAEEILRNLGADVVRGDITRIETLGPGMKGCDALFHVAGHNNLGGAISNKSVKINIDGTRNVLNTAYKLGIPRIIYTSSVGIYGNTQGRIVDSSYVNPGPHTSEYTRTKWVAHHEVVKRFVEMGAPITTVIPGAVFGPGDNSLIHHLMRAFIQGYLPFFVQPGPSFSMVYIDDVAKGHILALEKGEPGEEYILTGLPMSSKAMLEMWSVITGIPEPLFYLNGKWAMPLIPVVRQLENWVSLPTLISADSISLLETTMFASSEKSRQELGWDSGSVLHDMESTLTWEIEQKDRGELFTTKQRQIAGLSLMLGIISLIGWLIGRSGKK